MSLTDMLFYDRRGVLVTPDVFCVYCHAFNFGGKS